MGPHSTLATPTPRIPSGLHASALSCHLLPILSWQRGSGLDHETRPQEPRSDAYNRVSEGPGPGTVAGSTVSSPPRPLPSFFTPFDNLRWFHSALCLCCCFSSQQQQPAAAACTSITTIIINGTPSSISHYHHHQHQQKQPAAAAPAPAPVTNRLLFSPKKKNLKQLAGMPHCRAGTVERPNRAVPDVTQLSIIPSPSSWNHPYTRNTKPRRSSFLLGPFRTRSTYPLAKTANLPWTQTRT